LDFVTPEQHEALGARVVVLESGGVGGGDAILSAGQSNESGRGSLSGAVVGIPQVQLLGNDYVIRQAAEPVDDPTGQLDTVSIDTGGTPAGHSSLLKMAVDLSAARRGGLLIVPAAKGGSTTAQWLPTANPLNRATLFGSAVYRALTARNAGYTLRAVTWFQGENNAVDAGLTASFAADTQAIWAGFRQHLGTYLPVHFTQLAIHGQTQYQAGYQSVREAQRRLEDGSGDSTSVPFARLNVAHDLPMNSDIVHLDQAGQIELGKRRALAMLQHTYRVPGVDGTGPRLVSVTRPTSTTVKVKTTQMINTAVGNYDGYFKVFDGASAATISSVQRDPADNTAVLITLSAAPAGAVSVEYSPPIRAAGVWAVNCVRSATVQPGLTYALPLPAFSVTI
jgi:hypothetical protein